MYCLKTSQKKIVINGIIFADWDDLYGIELLKFKRKYGLNSDIEIHLKFDRGYNNKVPLQYGFKHIKDVVTGDILRNGERVYGTVELSNNSYHLLTDVGTFDITVGNRIGDYNTLIDNNT